MRTEMQRYVDKYCEEMSRPTALAPPATTANSRSAARRSTECREGLLEMFNGEKLIDRPLRWGMVGGGRTGQVGYKHRTGALRDNTAYRLVCGAFDLDVERGRDFGRNLGVAEDRLYPDYKTLIAEEAKRDDGVEVVTIATPNFTHYEITKACLEAGIHVICEKPLFFTVAECEEIAALAEAKGLIVGVTYGFTGHPLVHQMAAMVKKGMLGDIRMVDLQYTHGFNAGDDAKASEAREVAHQSEDLRPDLRPRRHRHAYLLPVAKSCCRT